MRADVRSVIPRSHGLFERRRRSAQRPRAGALGSKILRRIEPGRWCNWCKPHRGADQWLFILSGSGVAVLAGREHRLKAGSIVLIERGTTHEIRNTGRTPLKTLNMYVPPAYRSDGNELPRGRS